MEGAWYTDSNLRDPAFKRRFEEKYPDRTMKSASEILQLWDLRAVA